MLDRTKLQRMIGKTIQLARIVGTVLIIVATVWGKTPLPRLNYHW